MASALLLGQDVHLSLEVGVRGDRLGCGEHLAALYLILVDASEQSADVVAGLALVKDFAEHLDPGAHCGLGLSDANDLDRVSGVDLALLHPAGHHGAPSGDREHVLDGHQEGLLEVAFRLRDELVDLAHQLENLFSGRRVTVHSLEGRDPHYRRVVTGKLVFAEKLTHLQFDQLQQFFVVDHVALV